MLDYQGMVEFVAALAAALGGVVGLLVQLRLLRADIVASVEKHMTTTVQAINGGLHPPRTRARRTRVPLTEPDSQE